MRMKTDRRQFVKTTAMAASAVALSGAAGAMAAGETKAPRPNILFFIADDWGRNASCYRDPARPSVNDAIQTPNIDRVAREGVLFRNAFVGVSSCAPSRAAVATGCYFWRCGKRAFLQPDPGWDRNHIPDPGAALPGFGNLLQQQAGYAASFSLKALQKEWFPWHGIQMDAAPLRFGLYAEQNALGRDETAKVFEKAVRGVMRRVLAGRQPGQPFCHILGPVGPHRPFAKGSGMRLWGIEPDALKGKMPAFIPDAPEIREDYADTLGEVLALDLEVGWMLDELDKAGELDNTMLVLSGDNGVCMPRGKTQCYDLAVRAPLMIRWPRGIAAPGRVLDDFVSLMDLAPTWLEAAGIAPPATMDGRSLLPLLRSEKSGLIDGARDHVIVGRERHEPMTRPDGMPYPMRAIRTADFLYIRNFKPDRWPSGDPYDAEGPNGDPKYAKSGTMDWLLTHRDDPSVKPLYDLIFGKRPAEELYDLKRDPDQMRNVAGNETYRVAKQKLSDQLMKVLRDSHDPRLTDAFDRPPYVDPANVGQGAGKQKAKSE